MTDTQVMIPNPVQPTSWATSTNIAMPTDDELCSMLVKAADE
jgi:hypothetical protein